MPDASPFADDWRDSLEAHFKTVSRLGDSTQRADARAALQQAGYSREQIALLYVEATMDPDALPDDFSPDLAMIETLREVRHPNECTCPLCKS